MLLLKPADPVWIEIAPASGDNPAVEVEFAPIGTKAVRAARRAVVKAYGIDPEDNEEAGDALSRELIRRGIRDWRGIGDASGVPIAVTPETIELFIADPRTFEAADLAYVMPWVRADRDRNVSPLLPAGTGAEAMLASDIAASSAKRKRKGAASQTPKPDRPAAPTSSTIRKAKPGKASGTA